MEVVSICGRYCQGSLGQRAALLILHRLAGPDQEDCRTVASLLEPHPPLAELFEPISLGPADMSIDHALSSATDVECMYPPHDKYHLMNVSYTILSPFTDMTPILKSIEQAPQVFLSAGTMNDSDRDEYEPGAVAFSTVFEGPICMVFPRSGNGLGDIESITLFNLLFTKQIYAFNKTQQNYMLKKMESNKVPRLLDIGKLITKTKGVAETTWFQNTLGLRPCRAGTRDIFREPKDCTPGALFHLAAEVSLLTQVPMHHFT
jgi:hypothetical protein